MFTDVGYENAAPEQIPFLFFYLYNFKQVVINNIFVNLNRLFLCLFQVSHHSISAFLVFSGSGTTYGFHPIIHSSLMNLLQKMCFLE